MADDFSLIQKIALAGRNAGGDCSPLKAHQFLAMLRAVQEHDEKAALIKSDRQAETRAHPWDAILD